MKTPLSESIDPNDRGRISEEEMAPWIKDEMQWHIEMLNKSEMIGFKDALIQVSRLPFIQNKLTPDEILHILNLHK